MASQTVRFDYDPARNVLFVEDEYTVNTPGEVDAFLAHYESKFREIGRKVYMVVGIDGLRVGGQAFVYYGARIKALSGQWLLGLARWGTDPLARMTVRAASVTAKYDITIYDSKQAAIAAIDNMTGPALAAAPVPAEG